MGFNSGFKGLKVP